MAYAKFIFFDNHETVSRGIIIIFTQYTFENFKIISVIFKNKNFYISFQINFTLQTFCPECETL